MVIHMNLTDDQPTGPRQFLLKVARTRLHLTVEDGGAALVHGAEDGAALDQRPAEGTVPLKNNMN